MGMEGTGRCGLSISSHSFWSALHEIVITMRNANARAKGGPQKNIGYRTLQTTRKAARAHRADYQELKQELGLEWRGFHHHATPCIAAYGFLISERRKRVSARIANRPSLRAI